MTQSYLPTRQQELLGWSANFKNIILEDAEDLGLTSDQATAYQAVHNLFASLLATCLNGDTRTPAKLVEKSEAMANLKREARKLVNIIQACPIVTNSQREALHIPIRDREPTPRYAPGYSPQILVRKVVNTTVYLDLRDAQAPDSRTLPPTAEGATIFAYCGDNPPPANDPGWIWMGQTGKTLAEIQLPANVTSSKCYITAVWYTKRGELSPATNPPVLAVLQVPGAAQPQPEAV